MYDVLIVGGGVGGYTSAIKLSRKGKKVLLVEKERIGGTCLNKGCIPTKAFLESAGLYLKIKEAEKKGIKVDKVDFDWEEILNYKNSIVEKLVKGVEFLLKKNKAEVLKGKVKIVSKNNAVVNNEKKVEFKNLIVAVGSKPTTIPPFTQIDGERILLSDHIFSLKKIPESILIVGAGVIGIEMATVFSAFGSQVYVVEIMDEILPGTDKEMAKRLRKILKEKGIEIYTGSKIIDFKDEKKIRVKVQKNDEIKEFEVDSVLISVGRKGNTDELFCDSIKVEVDKKGFIKVDSSYRVLSGEALNFYAIGDVIGGKLLAHRAMRHGEEVSDVLLGKPIKKTDDYFIPSVVYTIPELASSGMSEELAKEKGYNVEVGRFPLSANGKSMIEGDTSGIVKIVMGDGKLLGVHILSLHAGEMIAPFTKLIKDKVSYKELKEIVFPHPTISEAIGEAILNSNKEAIHILNK